MPNKKQKGSRPTQKFNCPWCGQRLWRLGSPKYQPITQVRFEPPHLTAYDRASGLAVGAHDAGQLDSWREEFFCEAHGQMWMELSQKAGSSLIAVLDESHDGVESPPLIVMCESST
jgi:hypothetical protein